MNVELPSTGCNILISDTSFYNYSNDRRTRQRWYIYNGTAHLESSSTSTYGYDYTGTCIHTGDLVYKPEIQVYFPIIAFCIICAITYFIHTLITRRAMP